MRSVHRIWNALLPGRVERDIDRELAFHIAERASELRAEGLSDDEALRRARQMLGNVIVQRERTRDADVARGMDTLLRNVRYAARALVRRPGFTIPVVLTLALGIGANSAVFSAIDAVLLRPLPFPDSGRLVQLGEMRKASSDSKIAPVRLDDWSRLNSTFEAIAGYFIGDVVDTTGELPERIQQAVVTPRFFDTLRVWPDRGRGFTAEEHRFGAAVVILISDRIWRDRGARPDAIGTKVQSTGGAATIVGIMPAFDFPDRNVDVWSPMAMNAPYAQSRSSGWFTGIGRLKPGVTIDQARADLNAVQARLAGTYPDTDRDLAVRIEPLKETMVGGARGSLWVVFAAVSVLLLVACTNIAALLLSRAAQREHEIALRYSLGASRAAVAMQLLTETTVLVLFGAALGVPVAAGIIRAFQLLAPDLPRLDEIALNGRFVVYTIASAVIVALLCGLLPAIRSARGHENVMRAAERHVLPRHSLQWLFVGAQVALSVTLLAGAGLLLRTVDALSRVNLGFNPAHVLTFHLTGRFGEDRGDYTRTVRRINSTLDELRTLPGIDAAATALMAPGVPGLQQQEFELAEGRAGTEPRLIAESRFVSPSYFDTLAMPILDGELCRRPEDARGTTEVMVNRSFADRYFPNRRVIGLHLKANTPDRITGVVGDARELGPDRDPVPTVYACFAAPTPFPWFLVRTSGEPRAAIGAIRMKLKALEPLRPVYDVAPLEDRIGDAYAQNRLRTVLLTLFAVTALGMACAGVYGTLSYVVSLRRREVAVHLALGAMRRDVIRTLITTAARVVTVGCSCGLVLALIFTRSLSAMLYGISPSDPATLAGVIALVLAVAAAAALVPAARAAFMQPMRTLRED